MVRLRGDLTSQILIDDLMVQQFLRTSRATIPAVIYRDRATARNGRSEA